MTDNKKSLDLSTIENTFLELLMTSIKQQDIIDALLQHAKEPSLFKGEWEQLENTSEEAKSHLIKAIKHLVPEEVFNEQKK